MLALVVSLVAVGAGGAWLLWLRSSAASWKDALHRRQIQGFNGLLLVGIGLMGAIIAAVDLIPALLPYRDAIRLVLYPVGALAIGMVARKLLPADGGARAR